MSTRAEQYIAKMEESNILLAKEMTFVEYADSLVAFQDMLTKLVMGNEYEVGMRIDEVIFRLEAKGRAMGISSNHRFRKGIESLKKVKKEIAISLSGKKGENLVARTLEFVTRPNTTMYRNVYVSDGFEETELDNVILTNSGIIILETKHLKDDVTITEQGRLVHSGDECYDKQPLCEKMKKKRRLLKEKLEMIMEEKGLNIPIRVESFIVFSSPKGVRIQVDDKLHKEKWCYRTGLVKKIDCYIGLASYNDEQLAELDSVLSAIETQIKRFPLTLNFDEIRADIAEVLAMFDEEHVIEKTKVAEKVVSRPTIRKQSKYVLDITTAYARSSASRRTAAVIVGAFTSIACVCAISASAFIASRV